MSSLLLSVLFVAGATGLAFVLARLVGGWSIIAGARWGVVSRVSDRSSHTTPTSRLGGIALGSGWVIPFWLLILILWLQPRSLEHWTWGGNIGLLGWITVGAIGMFAVGLADDLISLPPLAKLTGQFLAALTLPAANLRFLSMQMPAIPGFAPPFVAGAAGILWVVFFVNVFNFMDGMDGFATRFAMNFCWWLFLSIILRSILAKGPGGMDFLNLRIEVFLLPILGGACGGFYRLNHPPAKVFMGDEGSHFLGYLLAIQLLLADGEYYVAREGIPTHSPTIPAGTVVILLLPFIFDATVTLLRRARQNENLLAPHRSHLYQRLMICGMTHREVLLLNLKFFRFCDALALLYAVLPWFSARCAVWIAASVAMVLYWRLVLRRESRRSQAAQ